MHCTETPDILPTYILITLNAASKHKISNNMKELAAIQREYIKDFDKPKHCGVKQGLGARKHNSHVRHKLASWRHYVGGGWIQWSLEAMFHIASLRPTCRKTTKVKEIYISLWYVVSLNKYVTIEVIRDHTRAQLILHTHTHTHTHTLLGTCFICTTSNNHKSCTVVIRLLLWRWRLNIGTS